MTKLIKYLKYDGNPFLPHEVYTQMQGVVLNGNI